MRLPATHLDCEHAAGRQQPAMSDEACDGMVEGEALALLCTFRVRVRVSEQRARVLKVLDRPRERVVLALGYTTGSR